MKTKKIKAWAIVGKEGVLSNWSITYAVFVNRKKATMFLPTVKGQEGVKVVPCEIIIKQ